MFSSNDYQVALEACALLGEGPLWDQRSRRLLWVDIHGQTVGRFDPVTGRNESIPVATMVGAVVPAQDGGLVVALQEGFARLDPVSHRLSTPIRPAGHDGTTTRFNDGKCDPAGRFLAGTMSLAGAPRAGALHVLEAGGQTRTLLTGVSISNGLAWRPDGQLLYYIDTPTRRVAAFDYDLANGTLRNRRIALDIPAVLGYPDGMTIDAEGMLWIALWGGGAVTRWDPSTGRLLSTHRLPVSHVTSCAFGGDKLDILFVTTARTDLGTAQLAAEPLAGSIFTLEPRTEGMPASVFAG